MEGLCGTEISASSTPPVLAMIVGKAVNEHGRFGSTERTAGKKLKCQALLRAKAIFSRGCRHLAKTEPEKFESDKQSICRRS
jgi:hypothetical protein